MHCGSFIIACGQLFCMPKRVFSSFNTRVGAKCDAVSRDEKSGEVIRGSGCGGFAKSTGRVFWLDESGSPIKEWKKVGKGGKYVTKMRRVDIDLPGFPSKRFNGEEIVVESCRRFNNYTQKGDDYAQVQRDTCKISIGGDVAENATFKIRDLSGKGVKFRKKKTKKKQSKRITRKGNFPKRTKMIQSRESELVVNFVV